ncbi:hypothetical protein AcW1_001114 [Taiwanofungus camphoratus]|nr:hypothetical protein AcW2_000374 [Antrodia cinnamomea]KAI0937033.1 hypothetical protein AcV5_005029 [Antrodia cinnamomea]KAI0962254.1 hypothetical protein AcV7_001135 [Antrodia cinnamomea]KAI0964252.1 hypothetical protein AcW1_001114 [Antrodia cinnamomea]
MYNICVCTIIHARCLHCRGVSFPQTGLSSAPVMSTLYAIAPFGINEHAHTHQTNGILDVNSHQSTGTKIGDVPSTVSQAASGLALTRETDAGIGFVKTESRTLSHLHIRILGDVDE